MILDQEGITSTHLGKRERSEESRKGQEPGQEVTTVNFSYGQEGKEPVLSLGG